MPAHGFSSALGLMVDLGHAEVETFLALSLIDRATRRVLLDRGFCPKTMSLLVELKYNMGRAEKKVAGWRASDSPRVGKRVAFQLDRCATSFCDRACDFVLKLAAAVGSTTTYPFLTLDDGIRAALCEPTSSSVYQGARFIASMRKVCVEEPENPLCRVVAKWTPCPSSSSIHVNQLAWAEGKGFVVGYRDVMVYGAWYCSKPWNIATSDGEVLMYNSVAPACPDRLVCDIREFHHETGGFSPDFTQLACGSSLPAYNLSVWADLGGVWKMWDLRFHRDSRVLRTGFSADSSTLAVFYHDDGGLVVWRKTGDESDPYKIVCRTYTTNRTTSRFALSADGSRLVADVEHGAAVCVWDTLGGGVDAKPVKIAVSDVRGHVNAMCVGNPGKDGGQGWVAVAVGCLSIAVWDVAPAPGACGPRKIADLKHACTHTMKMIASPDQRFLAASASCGLVFLWDTETWSRTLRICSAPDWSSDIISVTHMAFSADGRMIAGAVNGNVIVWEIPADSR